MEAHSCLALVACLFILITLFKEFHIFESFWKKFPFLSHVIPSWSFFAPVPYKSDYHILYRVAAFDQALGPWQQTSLNFSKRRMFHALWNPSKLFYKSSVDIIIDLLKIAACDKNSANLTLCLPYLHLLNYVVGQNHDPQASQIQFMIMSTSSLFEPELVFLSQTHNLEKRPC